MRQQLPGWKIALVVPAGVAEAFAAAVEPFAEAVSAFEIAPGKSWRIEAYTAAEPDRAGLAVALAVAAAATGGAEPTAEVTALPQIDWLAENRESFRSIRVGRYFIYPSHFAGPMPPGPIGLRVDAATAFGTGEHASTQGCLLALDRLARRRRPRRGLDMGCGTGILAIAAAKTWRVPVTAADVDPQAVRLARRNARRNGVGALVTVLRSDGYGAVAIARRGPYDLITANILARPLAAMAPRLAAHLAPGGVALLSGLLSDQERLVVSAHRAHGLRLRDRVRRDDWTTLLMVRAGG
jgi:ribosomal protein L11 methyltransferase